MPAAEIELAAGTSSVLATSLRDAVEWTLERYPERRASLRALRDTVLLRAEDTGETVTLAFDRGKLLISDGETGTARIRVVGDRDTILALTRLPLVHGLPDLRSDPGRLVLARQLGGELTVRGLLLRLPQVRRLLQVIAGG
jgi:hypothetical protein